MSKGVSPLGPLPMEPMGSLPFVPKLGKHGPNDSHAFGAAPGGQAGQ